MDSRRFNSVRQQTVYDWFVENDPAPRTVGKGSLFNAYFIGRHRTEHVSNDRHDRTSLSYAAMVAGMDNARAKASAVMHESCRRCGGRISVHKNLCSACEMHAKRFRKLLREAQTYRQDGTGTSSGTVDNGSLSGENVDSRKRDA